MSPFELILQLPFTESSWYAQTFEEWNTMRIDEREESLPFLTMLKRSWNPQGAGLPPDTLPSGSMVILYGVIAIARAIVIQENNTFTATSKGSLSSLGTTVQRSLDSWKNSWGKSQTRSIYPTVYQWRKCLCLFQLSHTLYELSPVDLQTLAGKETIEGKRIGPQDYAKSRKKLRAWVKQDRAFLGVSCKYPWFLICLGYG